MINHDAWVKLENDASDTSGILANKPRTYLFSNDAFFDAFIH